MFDPIFFITALSLGVGLSMDAFSISLVAGLNEPCMKVRKAAGMEHIQCDFPLLTRYAAPVHITRAAKV